MKVDQDVHLVVEVYEHSIRLHFEMLNNVAEYEVLINGMKIVKMLEATTVKLRTDSQLVAQQETKDLVAKEP